MMRRPVATALALALAACSGPADRTSLIAEAHSAVLGAVEAPVSARFDDTHIVAFLDEGLVCGGKVNAKDAWGQYTGFDPYYYARGRGAALPTFNSALHATLMRECARATEGAR